jgi:hypothetical protein
MRDKSSKPLLEHESPLGWLKASNRLFILSFLTGLTYQILFIKDIGTTVPTAQAIISFTDFLLIISISSFIMGLVNLFRISEFVLTPSSKTNLLFGKIIFWTAEIGIRVLPVAFIVISQIINGFLLAGILPSIIQNGLPTPFIACYTLTLVLSFIGMIPVIIGVAFHFKEEMKRRDALALAGVVSPWIFLIVVASL